jgi:hypothetical protein
MSSVTVIVNRLKAHAPLVALVPAARIMAGELPLNTALPAIAVTLVSSLPRLTVPVPGTKVMNTDRVQVTVAAAGVQTTTAGTGYKGMKDILVLVLAACGNVSGTVGGVKVDSIRPDIEGPDFFNDAPAMALGSRDFLVRWTTT